MGVNNHKSSRSNIPSRTKTGMPIHRDIRKTTIETPSGERTIDPLRALAGQIWTRCKSRNGRYSCSVPSLIQVIASIRFCFAANADTARGTPALRNRTRDIRRRILRARTVHTSSHSTPALSSGNCIVLFTVCLCHDRPNIATCSSDTPDLLMKTEAPTCISLRSCPQLISKSAASKEPVSTDTLLEQLRSQERTCEVFSDRTPPRDDPKTSYRQR